MAEFESPVVARAGRGRGKLKRPRDDSEQLAMSLLFLGSAADAVAEPDSVPIERRAFVLRRARDAVALCGCAPVCTISSYHRDSMLQ